ncbi:MAG: efflux RND transporter periplasmic adaptor subunit [Sedimentisphaerales bacterium]|nr:efflux RND transporter periplasmic adaptor subunit [Sedimentisphaerales bacterium]
MRKLKIILIVIGCIVGGLIVLGMMGQMMVARQQALVETPKVRVESPRRGELIEVVDAPGEVQARRTVSIAAKVSARITELPYREGDKVTVGDLNANPPVPPSVLVRLDDTDLKEGLKALESGRDAQAAQIEVQKTSLEAEMANLAALGVSLEQARRDLQRQEQLLAGKDISAADVEATQSRVEELANQLIAARRNHEASELGLQVSEHRLRAADADIARARDSLSYTTIVAPIDGVIIKIFKEVGEVVTGAINYAGTEIMKVADLSEMLVIAQVNETDIAKVKPGQNVEVRIHAYGNEPFKGTVESIALTHVLDRYGSKCFETKIRLAPDERVIRTGLSADTEIETVRHKDILTVPSQAVLSRPTDDLPAEIRKDNPNVDMNKNLATVVYRLIDGKAVVTPVAIGPSDATHTVLTSGVSEADQIIVGPYKVLESIKHDQTLEDENKKDETETGKDGEEVEPKISQRNTNLYVSC